MNKVIKVMLTQEEYDTVLTALKMELNQDIGEDGKKLLNDALNAMYNFKLTRE